MIQLPEYTDGKIKIYKVNQDTTSDYPVNVLDDTGMEVWFREISVFDRTRYEFDQGGKEITMKIRIPQYKEIDSNCAGLINDRIHQIYHAAHIIDKNGFPETELTLIQPEKELTIS